MTEKQKKAVKVLNTLRINRPAQMLNDEDYFLLLDFVVEQPQPQVQYIPYYPWSTQQIYADGKEPMPPFEVTCSDSQIDNKIFIK